MRRPALPLALVAALLVGLLIAGLGPRLLARTPPPPQGFGGQVQTQEEAPPAPRIYYQAPVTDAAAKIWAKLRQPLAMPFAQETPLEDVLKYVQTATAGEGMERGLQFYVDPAGLLEAEKTLQSPVTLNLEGLPLTTTLDLLLKQLDLTYVVRPEGYVLVTYVASRSPENLEPIQTLLDEVRALRQEIASMRSELRTMHGGSSSEGGGPPNAPTRAVTGGGFRSRASGR
jgi:hypothetical protein